MTGLPLLPFPRQPGDMVSLELGTHHRVFFDAQAHRKRQGDGPNRWPRLFPLRLEALPLGIPEGRRGE